jgi:hypothetical protein
MAQDAWFKELVPTVLPSSYHLIESHDYENGVLWEGRNHRGPFSIIMTGQIEEDGKKWLHVSVARPDKLPEWDLLKEIKAIFIGRSKQAIQIFPNEAMYVNQHPYCLHLFCCVDAADPVPNFARHGSL